MIKQALRSLSEMIPKSVLGPSFVSLTALLASPNGSRCGSDSVGVAASGLIRRCLQRGALLETNSAEVCYNDARDSFKGSPIPCETTLCAASTQVILSQGRVKQERNGHLARTIQLLIDSVSL